MSETQNGTNSVAGEELRQFISRIESLETEKAHIGDDIKDVYAELAARGYDKKIVRQIVAIRKKDPDQIEEQAALLDLYSSALGMFLSTFTDGLRSAADISRHADPDGEI